MIKLQQLLNEETFTATNKATGKTSVFKSKDSRDAAIKAGTHDEKKDAPTDKGNSAKGSKTPKVNIFDKPSSSEPKSDAPKATPADLAVDKVVYNTRTKTVGIVRLPLERGEVKTDADGNVNADELEPYNPMKYPHQKDAKVAPSTQKEVDSRGLWNPFSTNEPTSDTSKEPKQRKGVPAVNKAVRQQAQKLGITPEKLGKDEYLKKMAQAAVSALTDSNYHPEARQLVADLEGKPEMAEKPEYPSMKDPKYKEKMDAIRAKYDSVYNTPDKDADELGTSASQSAEWSGDTAIDAIAFDLRMNGYHKLADKIQSVIKEGKVNRTSLMRMMNESEAEEIASLTGLRTQAVKKFIDDNNINDRKLLAYLKIKGPKTLSNRMDISTAIVGKPGNKFAQGIIKAFSK